MSEPPLWATSPGCRRGGFGQHDSETAVAFTWYSFSRPSTFQPAHGTIGQAELSSNQGRPETQVVDIDQRYQERLGGADAVGHEVERRVDDAYARYSGRLMLMIVNRLWPGRTGPETVMQGAWLSLAGRLCLPEADGVRGDELRRLLFRIALRHCDNANHRTARARREGRLPVQFSQLDVREQGIAPLDQGESALEWLEGEEWPGRIRSRLAAAGMDEREIRLFDLMLADRTIAEMAKETGLRVGRVRDRRIRILRIVEECYLEACR